MARSEGTEADARCLRLEASHGELLLPGIPNDITLDRITPKLPWTSFHILSSVSRAWLQAIRSHQVYNARVRSNSTETLVLVNYYSGLVHKIGLYSMRDSSVYELPPIPHLGIGIPWDCQCVSLDGKVYVLGGFTTLNDTHEYNNNLYVIDLTGQRGWKRCANMNTPRRIGFGCAVMNGKVYVFGGIVRSSRSAESEVYDPEDNKWSSIAPITPFRTEHDVEVVGEELLVHNGTFYHPDLLDSTIKLDLIDRIRYKRSAYILEVYHPGKDEWRSVEPFGRYGETTFMAKEKFYSIRLHRTGSTIHVHEVENNSWTYLRSCSVVALGPGYVCLRVILAVNDELLARVDVSKHGRLVGSYLIQCGGFGGKEKNLMWERKAEFSVGFNKLTSRIIHILYPIQL